MRDLVDLFFDVLIRVTGNLVLGVFGRDLRLHGDADDWAVYLAGFGFWIVIGVLTYLVLGGVL